MTSSMLTSSRRLLIGGLVAVIGVLGLVLADASSSTAVATPYNPQPSYNPEPPSDPQELTAQTIRTYDAFDADQGVAVDRRYFYSIDNYSITKHDRATGKAVLQWYGGEDGPIIHLDGGSIVDGLLYAPHSNYHSLPEVSSIEVWDPRTMQHVATHSFGIERGSMTWIDRHDGHWWATFANYDKVPDGQTEPYGKTLNTQLVEMNDRFQIIQAWNFPDDMVEKFRPMSNSGGSWGPDGRLYITGHDNPEIYVVALPAAGATVRWVATISAPQIAGQGIAWDRSSRTPTLWGISRDSKEVVQMSVPLQPGRPTPPPVGRTYGPGSFIEPTS